MNRVDVDDHVATPIATGVHYENADLRSIGIVPYGSRGLGCNEIELHCDAARKWCSITNKFRRTL